MRLQSIPQALATRARIVLGSAAGESVRGLAARLGVTQTTVCLWRRRYRSAGLEGLRTADIHLEHDAAVLAHAVELSLRAPPQGVGCEIRIGAEIAGMSRSHQIEKGDQMTRVWIITVDPVAVDWNIAVRWSGDIVSSWTRGANALSVTASKPAN